MKTSADFGKAFQEITGEVKQTIIDLLENQQKVSSLEIDEVTGFNHAIGYYSDMNGWIEQNVTKVETAPNGEIILINEYGEELFNENIPDSEWAVVLECIEAQLEKNSKPCYYPVVNQYNPTERHCFGYGDITNIDECESFNTLLDAKREVLRRMANEGMNGRMVDMPVHTIYERKGDSYKAISVAVARHHAYLLGIDANDIQDALFCDGFKTKVDIL